MQFIWNEFLRDRKCMHDKNELNIFGIHFIEYDLRIIFRWKSLTWRNESIFWRSQYGRQCFSIAQKPYNVYKMISKCVVGKKQRRKQAEAKEKKQKQKPFDETLITPSRLALVEISLSLFLSLFRSVCLDVCVSHLHHINHLWFLVMLFYNSKPKKKGS